MKRRRLLVATVLLILAGLSLGAAAAPTGVLSLERWVLGGGGGYAAGGRFTLESTIGQGVAGLIWGGSAELCSGFWCGAGRYAAFLPLTLRGF